MHTATIIKLIGERPVYRVERNPGSGTRAFEEHRALFRHSAPVIDRTQWNRPMAGSDISNPAARGGMERPEAVPAAL
jgi:hypothetical protein